MAGTESKGFLIPRLLCFVFSRSMEAASTLSMECGAGKLE